MRDLFIATTIGATVGVGVGVGARPDQAERGSKPRGRSPNPEETVQVLQVVRGQGYHRRTDESRWREAKRHMRAHGRGAMTVALGTTLLAQSSLACAECDPAKSAEPIASRFETHGDTVYDRNTNLTWMRCSYGQVWIENGGCSGSVKLLDWDSAMGLRLPGNAAWRLPQKDELGSIVATNCRGLRSTKPCFPERRRSSTGRARPAAHPTLGSYSFGPACRRGISSARRHSPFDLCAPVNKGLTSLSIAID